MISSGKLVAATNVAPMRGEKIVSESNIKQQASDGRADFDFFMGSWKIQNRILRERLKGSTSWEEFGGTSVARKILGGLGHLEEFTMDRALGATEGVAVRLFDPKTQQWSVSAADNRNGFDPRPSDWRVQGWALRVLFARTLGGPVHLVSGYLVGDHRHLVPLGASVLRR